jgi:hypothetical protein
LSEREWKVTSERNNISDALREKYDTATTHAIVRTKSRDARKSVIKKKEIARNRVKAQAEKERLAEVTACP